MAYQKTTHTGAKGQDNKAIASGITSRPIITVDYEKYAHFLEDADLSEEQKLEFLQALWNVIVEFVSLGFGVHPLQEAQTPCGQEEKRSPPRAIETSDRLYLDQSLLNNFIDAAAPLAEPEEEGFRS